MKILWITTIYSWTYPLADAIADSHDLLIINPTLSKMIIEERKFALQQIIMTEHELTGCSMNQAIANKYLTAIRAFNPDIIHIHGTERNYGQIQNYITNIPIVIGIQGILNGCVPFVNNYIRQDELRPHKTLKNIFLRGGVEAQRRMLMNRSQTYEMDIIKQGKAFFCRTNWDKAWITFNNPLATIINGEELLRSPFYENAGKWSLAKCQRHNIFMPSGFNPLKGFHLAIKALALLKKFYADVVLTVPGLPQHILSYGPIKSRILGEEYVNYCKGLIRENQLEHNIKLLPRLDADEMACEMIKANVFLSPTSIDNSPNAVGEATMIGTPVVATPVGGVPSMLKDEESCLFAPAGDEFIMAYQIKRIFDDDILATTLSKNAYQIAVRRHNITATTSQYINAYSEVISLHKPTTI